MQNWNYQSHLKFFPGKCGDIRGSGGEFYAPKQTRDRPVELFTADMCRTLSFDYEKDYEVHNILGYKYIGGRRTVDNGTDYPENKCFCTKNCAPSGTLDISACRFGSPVYMSFPHFYNADNYYLQTIDGLNPEKEKHEFSITLEPVSFFFINILFYNNYQKSNITGLVNSKLIILFLNLLFFILGFRYSTRC